MEEIAKYIDNTYHMEDDIREWDNLYDLNEMGKDYNMIVTEGDVGYIFISKDLNSWINFYVIEKYTEVEDNIYGKLIWYGEGFSSSLRELRHSYFAPYMFYMPAKLIEESFKELRTYFDI